MAEERRGLIFENGTRVASGSALLSAAEAESVHPAGCRCGHCCTCGSEICHASDLNAHGNDALVDLHRRRYWARVWERADEIEKGGTRHDMERALQHAGVPADSVANAIRFRPNLLTDAGAKFLQAPRDLARFLVLSGNAGLGKSVAAAVVMAEWMRRRGLQREPSGPQPPLMLWVDGPKMNVADPQQLDDMRRSRLFVLDDMGKESREFGRASVLDVLFARSAKNLPTVVTTNLKREDLPDVYQSEALLDRLRSSAIWPDTRGMKSLRRVAK